MRGSKSIVGLYTAEWYRRQRIKSRVAGTVNRALGRGAIARPACCERCGVANKVDRRGWAAIVGHHPDYTQPLLIEWLCDKCHRREHRRIDSGISPCPYRNCEAPTASEVERAELGRQRREAA